LPFPTIKVSRRAADRLRQGHIWVYRSDLISKEIFPPGSLLNISDERGKPLGAAFYSSSSEISLRLISSRALADEAALWDLLRARVRAAAEYRLKIVRDSNAYRVIFSEADRLPGFIADRYNSVLSIQTLTQAMDRPELKNLIINTLFEALAPAGVTSVVERVEPRIRELEHLPEVAGGLLRGSESSAIFTMNGIRFHYDSAAGQKTGAFLDQRENYAAAAERAHGAALDVFCYQGGFALHLARSCSSVTALDSSRPALEVAERNEKLNPGAAEIEWVEGNAFDYLKDKSALGPQYDSIVLDPPAFAKNKRSLDTAMRGYKELNLRALKMLRPAGLLVTCSCSYHVSDADFLQMLTSAAADTHKTLRLLEQRSQSLDHPILLNIPESRYLKCLICELV